MNANATQRSILKVAMTSLAGTSIEWYDFFLYGTAAALVLPTVIFASDLDPLVGLLASFSTFAVGFLARPIGGIVFGHFGDRVGRKKALVVALLIMGASTTLIGCLPSYAMIGAAAPLLLIALRFAQGLAIGGQWAGAVLLVTESAPPNRRGFYGSFAQVGAPVGIVLANLAFLIASSSMSPESFLSWGWRVPFLLSVALIGLALYVQLRLEDTAEFQQLRQLKEQHDAQALALLARERGMSVEAVRAEQMALKRPSPVLEALRTYPKQIALAAGAFLSVQVTFYVLVAFVVAYGTNKAGLNLPRSTMLAAVLIGAVAMIPVLLTSAAISDRYGRRGIYMLGAVLVGVWGFVMFPLIDTGEFLYIVLAVSVGQMLVGIMYGPQAAFLSEMFSTKVRYSGASLGYQLGAILGGAMAPLLATALLARYHSTFGISVYIAVASAITVISTYMLKETNTETAGSGRTAAIASAASARMSPD
jgi:MFS family permease